MPGLSGRALFVIDWAFRRWKCNFLFHIRTPFWLSMHFHIIMNNFKTTITSSTWFTKDGSLVVVEFTATASGIVPVTSHRASSSQFQVWPGALEGDLSAVQDWRWVDRLHVQPTLWQV